MKIIAIGHYADVGKDTFANYIIEYCQEHYPHLRVGKLSWAWKLKQICYELYGWAGLREPEFYETPQGRALKEVVLPAIGKSPRQIWIDFGTPAVRDCVYYHTWRDYVLKTDHGLDVLLIPDTRFFNEVEGVEDVGGHRVKLVRPGWGPLKNKPDRELLPYRRWNNVIGERGTLYDLRLWASAYGTWLGGHGPEPTKTLEQQDKALAVENIEPWNEHQNLQRASSPERELARCN